MWSSIQVKVRRTGDERKWEEIEGEMHSFCVSEKDVVAEALGKPSVTGKDAIGEIVNPIAAQEDVVQVRWQYGNGIGCGHYVPGPRIAEWVTKWHTVIERIK